MKPDVSFQPGTEEADAVGTFRNRALTLKMVEFGLDKKQFLEQFAEMLGVDATDLAPSTQLSSIENWDSVAYLSTMVLLDEKLGVAISPDDLTEARTVQDILNAAGPALKN